MPILFLLQLNPKLYNNNNNINNNSSKFLLFTRGGPPPPPPPRCHTHLRRVNFHVAPAPSLFNFFFLSKIYTNGIILSFPMILETPRLNQLSSHQNAFHSIKNNIIKNRKNVSCFNNYKPTYKFRPLR